jgi:hypothetical protein
LDCAWEGGHKGKGKGKEEEEEREEREEREEKDKEGGGCRNLQDVRIGPPARLRRLARHRRCGGLQPRIHMTRYES